MTNIYKQATSNTVKLTQITMSFCSKTNVTHIHTEWEWRQTQLCCRQWQPLITAPTDTVLLPHCQYLWIRQPLMHRPLVKCVPMSGEWMMGERVKWALVQA